MTEVPPEKNNQVTQESHSYFHGGHYNSKLVNHNDLYASKYDPNETELGIGVEAQKALSRKDGIVNKVVIETPIDDNATELVSNFSESELKTSQESYSYFDGGFYDSSLLDHNDLYGLEYDPDTKPVDMGDGAENAAYDGSDIPGRIDNKSTGALNSLYDGS